MPETTNYETQAYEQLLIPHLKRMSRCLRQMPEAQWDWTPDQAAPTARILGTHAYQWLICDRYHISEPDASKHPRVPDAPRDPRAMCDAFDGEIDNWVQMLRGLTPEQLGEERHQFNGEYNLTVRGFVCHMIQNCIYKNGQLSTLYFALGHDGIEPYDAPFPNPIYEEIFGPRDVPA